MRSCYYVVGVMSVKALVLKVPTVWYVIPHNYDILLILWGKYACSLRWPPVGFFISYNGQPRKDIVINYRRTKRRAWQNEVGISIQNLRGPKNLQILALAVVLNWTIGYRQYFVSGKMFHLICTLSLHPTNNITLVTAIYFLKT